MMENQSRILNPATGRYVKKNGKIGRALLGQEEQKTGDSGYVINSLTGRKVKKAGKVGQAALARQMARQQQQTPPAKKASSKKQSPKKKQRPAKQQKKQSQKQQKQTASKQSQKQSRHRISSLADLDAWLKSRSRFSKKPTFEKAPKKQKHFGELPKIYPFTPQYGLKVFLEQVKPAWQHIYSGSFGSGFLANTKEYGDVVVKLVILSGAKDMRDFADEFEAQRVLSEKCDHVPKIYGGWTLSLMHDHFKYDYAFIMMEEAGLQPLLLKEDYPDQYKNELMEMCSQKNQLSIAQTLRCFARAGMCQNDENLFNILYEPRKKRFYLIDFGLVKGSADPLACNLKTLIAWTKYLLGFGKRKTLRWECPNFDPLMENVRSMVKETGIEKYWRPLYKSAITKKAPLSDEMKEALARDLG
jgi:hypothetical protein